ncbi:choice-of-anchor J domain-containing protein [Muribaculum intestinale]|uniref:choice-of-anchor J domain-containing protein n=1 Tax=Muribaculum intestinale TaxID=1796646 RepID=UPI0025A99F97|nr:choice-of-anchor J domain-containing protein [Muribaculum intestinale]
MKQSKSLMMLLSLSLAVVVSATVPVTPIESHPELRSTQISNLSVERTVLSEKEMAPGIVQRVVRDREGHIYKDMVKHGKVSAGRQNIRKVFKAPANATFYEGFEGHAGELDWLPEGWTEINTPENKPTLEMCSHNINNSWSGQDTGDGYWTAITTDGVKECWIHFTYNWSYKNSEGEKVEGAKAPQDEWLITPEITVGANDDLFFLAEADLGSVYDYNWSVYMYERDRIDTDLEVHVTTDGGDTWTCLWKLSEKECAGKTDAELYDLMGELQYESYCVPLTDYRGKKVKIAFRYLTPFAGGNSMAVDAVTVAAPQPEAFYTLTEGSLLAGISDGLHSNTEPYILIPADKEINWSASSNVYTETNSWAFYSEASGEMTDIVEGNTAKVSYGWSHGGVIPYPVLTASNINGSHKYSFGGEENKGGMYVGGRIPNLADETVYLGNYDYVNKGLAVPNFGNGSYCFGTSATGTWGNNIKQTAIGNLFYAPAAPLTVTDVMLTLGEFDADDDAVISLEIYNVDSDGRFSAQPVATSSVTGKEITGFGFYNAIFHLATPYEMSGHTFVMIKGFDSEKVREFAACAQSEHNDAAHNYAYMMFEINGEEVLYSASDALVNYSSALYISLNGTYHVLSLSEEIVTLDETTNMVEVAANATNSPENWWVVDTANDNARLPLVAEGTTFDWLTITPVTGADGSYAVRFSAARSSVQRSKTVSLGNGGTEVRIRVKQSATTDTSGIDGVNDEDGCTLAFDGDILTVCGMADDETVCIYDAYGRMVYAGVNNVDTRILGKGIYIVRCGAYTAKFAK